MTIKNNIIYNIVQKIKGNNFEFDIKKWILPDFSLIFNNISDIKNSFDKFIIQQKLNEENDLNDFLQTIIKSNFDDLLDNLIPSFGNDFFDRIIFYNENFKIDSLYNNLKWGLAETLTYYVSIFSLNSISSLTKDLKIKIFSLNDLDQVISKRNKEILDLLNVKINEFIEDSKNVLIERYIYYLREDVSIESAFDNVIQNKIDENLNIVISDIREKYNLILNKYLKDKIIDKYTKVFNDKTNEIIITVKDQREYIKSKFDDLFTVDPDDVLDDINIKLNNTKNAINEYKEYFNSIEISQDLISYVDNFGDNKIKPCFEGFMNLLNNITKHEIYDNIQKHSIVYENAYEKEKVLEYINNLFNKVKNEYIEIMNNSIYSYGIDDYQNNLNNKMNERRLRMLENNETQTLNSKNVADKSIYDIFHNLLNNSQSLKSLLKNYEKFDEFDNIIRTNIDKLNSSYKNSKSLIIKNNYEEETFNNISNKLDYLNNLTLDYYNKINDSFYQMKIYFDSSIEEIDNLLNLCANETFSTFKEKYDEISSLKISHNFDKEQKENENEDLTLNDNIKYQNKQYSIDTKIINLIKNAYFKFSFDFDEINNLKMPKVYAHVINLSKPKKLNINISSEFGTCGKDIDSYEIEFNKVNFSVLLDFNTDSNDIISTVITDFEPYQYTATKYTKQDKSEPECVDLTDFGLTVVCYEGNDCENSEATFKGKEIISIDKKYSKENITIPS